MINIYAGHLSKTIFQRHTRKIDRQREKERGEGGKSAHLSTASIMKSRKKRSRNKINAAGLIGAEF